MQQIIKRAKGCLLGQLAGDSLGSLAEFQSPEEVLRLYPDGLRDLADGGEHDILAGQPTDDFEMALLLARLLIYHGGNPRPECFWPVDAMELAEKIVSSSRENK